MVKEKILAQKNFESIFSPSTYEKRHEFYNSKANAAFVHYTSAEAALEIIRTKRMWMRNAMCMNDYKEITYGYEMLRRNFHEMSFVNDLKSIFEDDYPNVVNDTLKLFDNWWIDTRMNTFITSISEHDKKEDSHGRLSMWRAYGGVSGKVGIVLNAPWDSNGARALNIGLNPILYHNETQSREELNKVIKNLKSDKQTVISSGEKSISGHLFSMLINLVVCTKHEGFEEEKEWRAIYMPEKYPSTLMESKVTSVNGSPQIVFDIPFDKNISSEIEDLDFVNLFNKLIIGPTPHPASIAEAFHKELKHAGIKDAEKRINISGIPIRT